MCPGCGSRRFQEGRRESRTIIYRCLHCWPVPGGRLKNFARRARYEVTRGLTRHLVAGAPALEMMTGDAGQELEVGWRIAMLMGRPMKR